MILLVEPATALLIGTTILIVTGLLFWPDMGLVAMWNKRGRSSKRILLEDALKYIFDCEYKDTPCSLNTIAGNMNISSNKIAKILDHLQSIGLVKMQDVNFQLTDAGRSYALQIIRVHRVWERYLADETGIDQLKWHGAADSIEHRMSLEEANQLASRIGNPVFDPHGDPIPSKDGAIPHHSGLPLNQLKEGDIGRIIHIEDEPSAIYAQLMALDLYPGTQVYVMDISDEKIQFAANGEECVLTPLFASNVTVELLKKQEPIQKKQGLLSSLLLGEKAEIAGISPKCRGQERRRLMDLGIIPGTEVTAELKSASGDPIAYRVLGASIAIRKSLADNIFIRTKQKTKKNGQPS